MALPVNLKDTLLVTRFDYRNLVRSAPGVIFLVVYLLVVVQLGAVTIDLMPVAADKSSPLCKLPEGSAPTQVKDKIQRNLPPFSNVPLETLRHLECERPVVMSLFFLIALFVVPFLVVILSFNQMSGYLHRKSIRYMLPKTGRLELYLGLFLSNLKFFTVVSGAVTAAVSLGWLIVGRNLELGTMLLFSAQIFIALWLSAMPLIALMSMIAAMTGRPLFSFMLGFFGYLAFDAIVGYVALNNEQAKLLFYLTPLEAKYWFAYPSVGRFLGAAVLMLCYTAAYLAIGWLFLRRRNV